MSGSTPDDEKVGWTFLSNHALVLLAIARDPGSTLRAVAAQVGITERAVQNIIGDLEAGHYLERVRTGRRNRYEVHPESRLRHSSTSHRDIGALIELVAGPPPDAAGSAPPAGQASTGPWDTPLPQ